jgi:hypothetical protein
MLIRNTLEQVPKDIRSRLVLDMRDIRALDARTLRDVINLSVYMHYHAGRVRVVYLHTEPESVRSVAALVSPDPIDVFASEAELFRSLPTSE